MATQKQARVRVSDVADRIGSGDDTDKGLDRVWVQYDVLGWLVTVRSPLYYGYGAQQVEITHPDPAMFGWADQTEPAQTVTTGEGGRPLVESVTTRILRSIPMEDARAELSRLEDQVYAQQGRADEIPKKMRTPLDWARLAQAYVALVEAGETRPLVRMEQVSGVARNTLSARIRRCRDKDDWGFLTKPTGSGMGSLTAKAKKVLKEAGALNG